MNEIGKEPVSQYRTDILGCHRMGRRLPKCFQIPYQASRRQKMTPAVSPRKDGRKNLPSRSIESNQLSRANRCIMIQIYMLQRVQPTVGVLNISTPVGLEGIRLSFFSLALAPYL